MEYFCILTVRFTENGVTYTKGDSDVFAVISSDTAQSLYWTMYGRLKDEYGFDHAETVHWSCDPMQLATPARRQM